MTVANSSYCEPVTPPRDGRLDQQAPQQWAPARVNADWETTAPMPRSQATPVYPPRYADPAPIYDQASYQQPVQDQGSYPQTLYDQQDAGQGHQDRPPRRRVGNGAVFARMCALFYLLLIGLAVLMPDPALIAKLKLKVGHLVQRIAHHITQVPALSVGDVASNIAAFVPVTLLLALAWKRVPLWIWGVVGTVISISAEMLQLLLPQIHRRPLFWNVVQNSFGAWIGVAIAAVCFQLAGLRSREHL